jgi:hypothetical protein
LVVIENSPIFDLSLKQIIMDKLLEFYNQCLETGRLPKFEGTSGLCGCARNGLISQELLNVFTPTDEDENELEAENLSCGWWGSGLPPRNERFEDEKLYGFTNLRQTIIEFMMVIKIEDFLPETE